MTIAVWITHKKIPWFVFRERHLRRLREAIPEAEIRCCANKEEFLAVLPEAEIALVWVFKQEWFSQARRLRRLVTPVAGRDFLPVDPPPGVSVEFSTFHGRIMSETALAMMLCHARGILKAHLLLAKHPWPRAELAPRMRLLHGSSVTILGFGHIGRWIGRRAKCFGARLTGINRGRKAAPPDYFEAGDRILTVDRLEEVLPETDHLVLCLPATGETEKIMGARRLDLLPPHVGIYNLGRGNALDEEALAERLQRGSLGGAYLDVFRQEPLPEDSPLRRCPNCFILPHASAFAPEFIDLFVEEFLEKYRR